MRTEAPRLAGTTRDKADPAGLLASFVCYLKASWIYPDCNRRVVEAAQDVIRFVRTRARPGAWIQLRVEDDAFVVDGCDVNSSGPLAAWLRGVFRDSCLCGIELGGDLDAPSLSEFSKSLRLCRTGEGGAFVLDPSIARGLRPIEMVFGGDHDGGSPLEDGGDDTGGDTAGAVIGEAAAGGGRNSSTRLHRMLLRSRRVRERMQALERTLTDIADDNVAKGLLDELNLIDELVRLLPAEAVADPDSVDGVVDEMLSGLQREIARLGSEHFDPGIAKTALAVAKKFFRVRIDGDADRQSLPSGRSDDLGIEDRLANLVREYGALRAHDVQLDSLEQVVRDDTVQCELTGAYMHLLAHSTRPETREQLSKCLARILAEPTEGQWQIVERYLARPDEPGKPSLEAFLIQCGLATVLFESGRGSTELLVSVFPAGFLELVDILSLSPQDLGRLRDVVSAMPTTTLRDAAVELARSEQMTQPRVEKLMALGDTALPIVQGLCEMEQDWLRARVVRYLRERELPEAESSALHCVEPTHLPTSYLVELCGLGSGGSNTSTIRKASHLLCDFIERTDGDSSRYTERSNAILALELTPSRQAEQLLQGLASTGRWSPRRDVRAIRRLAATALDAVRAALSSRA